LSKSLYLDRIVCVRISVRIHAIVKFTRGFAVLRAKRRAKRRINPRGVGPNKPRLLAILGPGLIAGASDDDPSGIATYSQAGAQFRFSITWTLFFTHPLMAVIQEISGRIGRTTGEGIAANIRDHYPNWTLQSITALLIIANTINIGADLGAMGDAVDLLVGGPKVL
jgi:Mn2+/Fe2+ NRAMP family transporter